MTASARQQGHTVFYKTSRAASHNDYIQGGANNTVSSIAYNFTMGKALCKV